MLLPAMIFRNEGGRRRNRHNNCYSDENNIDGNAVHRHAFSCDGWF